jgi:NAD+ diphosphatase
VSTMNTFTGNPLDRAAAMRRDPEWISARLADPGTKYLLFQDLHPLLRQTNGGVRIAWLHRVGLSGDELNPAEITQQPILLGLDATGNAHFALSAGDTEPGLEVFDPSGFRDTRASAALLPAAEAAIIAQARSLLSWHDTHPFCARCGGETVSVEAGYSRLCTRSSCGAMHFPRTDPVVIMVVSQGDRVLLGRSVREPRYPVGMFSCLAGYIEPGESLEEAVRRETWEEAGIEIGGVRYHSSQPWPFPSTLMIGCFAEALTDRIDIDREEVEEARWFTRQETRAALERWSDPAELRLPPPITAAHQLIAAWLEHDVNGLCHSPGSEAGR